MKESAMLGFTPNQWIILFLVLVLGWLLGLLSRSGGGRWKREYEREREARQSEETRIRAANERIAELERHAPPVGAATGAGIGAAARGHRDDLSLIRGIGRSGETRLNEFGITRYRDLTALSPADEAALEGRLGTEPGLIAREQWREQADLLAHGKADEHRQRFA
jgi:predicted flap endonuclease-1-like 5' DNA nuclease